jgi:hypothetical protein
MKIRLILGCVIFLSAARLFAINTCSSHGGSCLDTGSTYSCPGGSAASWEFYCSGGSSANSLYETTGCNNLAAGVCVCGAADAGGPCAGCGYQSIRQAGFCYSDTSCSVTCTPVPESSGKLALLSSVAVFLILIATVILPQWRVPT